MSEKLMQGKKGLIMGVANDHSMAWGIAQECHKHGAELAFNYLGEMMEKRVRPLAESVDAPIIMPANVTDAASMDALFEAIDKKWGKLDFMLHAIAFSNKDELRGQYVNTSRDNFLTTMEISAFSFTDMCRRAEPLMKDGGSCVTLTYYGAERVMPHYNVMGVAKAALECSVRYLANDMGPKNIRVNAISAGPIKTLAASGIGDFKTILRWNELNAPLRRNMTMEDVSKSGMYLLSDLGSGVSGEVHHVDCGYHSVGMMAPDSAPELAEMLNNFNKDE